MSTASRASGFVGAIFDLDGTLTQPDAIDFAAMRRRIGMTEPGSILHWIADHATSEAEAEEMRAVVWDEEAKGLSRMELGDGFAALADVLTARRSGLKTAIATRNSEDAMDTFDGLLRSSGFPPCAELFDVLIARDHYSERLGRALLNKPSPEPTHEIKHVWKLGPAYPLHECHEDEPPRYPDLLFVGDAGDDLLSGRRAGAMAAFMDHGLGPVPAAANLRFTDLAACADTLAR